MNAPYGSQYSDGLPRPPLLAACTKKEFSHGFLLNGVHVPRMKSYEGYLDVFSDKYREIHCTSCGRRIVVGEIALDTAYAGHGWHCADCTVFPAGNLEAWRVTYPMKRKSHKHPDGRKTVYVVHHSQIVSEFIQAVRKAFPRGVEAERLFPSTALLTDPNCSPTLKGLYYRNLLDRKARITETLIAWSSLAKTLSPEEQQELIIELMQTNDAIDKLCEVKDGN